MQVRAYLDSVMVRQAIVENEAPDHRAPLRGAEGFMGGYEAQVNNRHLWTGSFKSRHLIHEP